MRRFSGVLLTLAVAACTPAVSTQGNPVPSVSTTAALSVSSDGVALFDSCDEVLSYFQGNALDQVTAWGLGGGWGAWDGFRLELTAMTTSDVAEGAPTYSTTNVQEAGIDEPDLIKTDGQVVVALAGAKLHVLDAVPRLRILGELNLGEIVPQNLFLVGNRVVVIGSAPMPMAGLVADAMFWMPPDTALALIDLSDPSQPELIEKLTLEGNLLSARLDGNEMSMVISSFPRHLLFVTPGPNGGPVAAERNALARNRRVIIETNIEDWFPRFRHEIGGGRGRVIEGPLVDCGAVARPVEFSGLSSTSVLTFDLEEGLAVAGSFGLASDAQTVYASATATYVATQEWHQLDSVRFDEGLVTTSIHRFDTSEAAAVTFTGTGEVPGWLYSQWALSEDSAGRLRVASTTSPPWGFRPGITQSVVSVLEPAEGRLETIGAIGGLGIDEQIYAVRFLDDLAYVVTFRQVDPCTSSTSAIRPRPSWLARSRFLGTRPICIRSARGYLSALARTPISTGR